MKTGVIGFVSLIGLGVAAPAFAQDAAAPAPPPEAAPAAAAPVAPAPEAPAPAEEKAEKERTANNALYVELLGAGLIYSINYDRRISDFAVRAGVEYFSVSASGGGASSSASWFAVPISATYNIGSGKHSFEIGAGATFHHFSASGGALGLDSSGGGWLVVGHGIVGYRYQPLDGGFFLRAGFTPQVGSGFFLPWPHVGLGATF